MTRFKHRIRVELDVTAVTISEAVESPEHAEPIAVALQCVGSIIAAIQAASQAAVKGDRKPTIPSGMPVDLVVAPGIVHSFTWGDLLAADQVLEID